MRTPQQSAATSSISPRPSDPVEAWRIDPERSSLTFTLRHLVVHEIRGRFRGWGGDLQLDRDQPGRSKLNVWVNVGSIETGDPERDAHVRSAEFLDVARYPGAEFATTGVDTNPDGSVHLNGTLKLHGISGTVELRVEPISTTSGSNGRPRSAFRARGKLNRQAFGLHWNQDLDVGGVVVGDEIEISANVELVRVLEQAPRDKRPPAT
jgi:polyisoprenoid-binding protein YceI